MKDIYILQMHTGTITDKAVRFFTRYDYSHIVLSLNKKFNKLYGFGRKKYNNPFIGGFVIEDINGSFFNKFNNTTCKIYKLKITKKQYKSLVKVLKEFEKNKSKYKYDILGLLLKIFFINVKRKRRYVCSQFIAEVLLKSEIHSFNKPCVSVKPKDFENINLSEVIYTGLFKNVNI